MYYHIYTVMYYHIHSYIYTYLQTYIFIRKLDIMLMNAKLYTVLTTPLFTTLLRRWYYVNAVPTTLVLRQYGSYYVITRSLPRSMTATLLLRKF